MAASIDREKVRDSFHRQAGYYDDFAVVQRRVVEKLIGRLRDEEPEPRRVLDIGTGTGALLARLRDRHPAALAVGADLALGMCRAASFRVAAQPAQLVNADAERLPFAAGSFDLAVSSSTFQWLGSLDRCFSEVKRVLAPGGVFRFALFGEKTLFELRDSYQAALSGAPDRSHGFFSRNEVLSALRRCGFAGAEASSEIEVERHPDVPALLRSLKRIGAGSAASPTAKGLSERRVMLEMMELYRKRYGNVGSIPASYEVIYGFGSKGSSTAAA